MKRAAIYCRVSTRDQNCDRQEQELVAYAQRANYEVVGIWKEKESGAKNDRKLREEVRKLAQKRLIDVILVVEMTRWGRSTIDLINSLNELAAWDVSLITTTGFTFDMSTAQGKLVASLMATLAEFERDLIRERVRSGLEAAKSRGVELGRKEGYNPTVDKHKAEVLKMVGQGRSYRVIAKDLGISKTTVGKIVRLGREKQKL